MPICGGVQGPLNISASSLSAVPRLKSYFKIFQGD